MKMKNQGIQLNWTKVYILDQMPFAEKILFPNDSGANLLSAETKSQEPLI